MPKLLEQPTNVFRNAVSLAQEELGRLERVREAIKAGARVAGIPTGFNALDDLFGGLNAGKLYFLGGKPGGGKTALALNIVLNASRAGYPVIYVSCDEGARRLALKLACIELGERLDELNRGGVTTNVETYISTNPQTLKNITIIESAHIEIAELGVEIERQVRQTEIPAGYVRQGLFVVDYLQAMASAQSDGGEVRFAIERLCTNLRNIAIANESACLCLSALSRGSDEKNYDDPHLSSFRETSAIEFSADGVMALFDDKHPSMPVSNPYLARKLRILKNRDGDSTAELPMVLNGATGRYEKS
jgi:replicative DNA helicase